MNKHILLEQQEPIPKPHVPIIFHAYARSARPLGVAGRSDGKREEPFAEEDVAGILGGESVPRARGLAGSLSVISIFIPGLDEEFGGRYCM